MAGCQDLLAGRQVPADLRTWLTLRRRLAWHLCTLARCLAGLLSAGAPAP